MFIKWATKFGQVDNLHKGCRTVVKEKVIPYILDCFFLEYYIFPSSFLIMNMIIPILI